MTRRRTLSVTRIIPARPEAIFEVLADPARHPEMDGSGTVRRARGNPARLSAGARFAMDMRQVVPYRITNRVVEFDEGRRIAWRHWGGHVWRFELEPTNGGTSVTQTFDWSTSRLPPFIELVGYPARHRPNMERTLERLERIATTGAA